MPRFVSATLVATLLLSSAALAGPKFKSTWRAPDAADTSFAGKKVAALIISQDESLRISGEEALVRELAAVGVSQGIASYRIVPREELRNTDQARGWYERAGAEGVVAMRLVDTGARQAWTPSTWANPYYSTLWGYYGYGWGSIHVPGYLRESTVAVIETLVFNVPQNKLLWAGVTQSANTKGAAKIIHEVVTATVKEMKKQGLVRAASK